MIAKTLTLALALLINFTTAKVISANYKNFKEVVLDSAHITMVEFFAPWCGHCKNLEPEYISAANRLNGFARLVQVDCDNSVNRELCGRYDVKGFPTLKIFNSGVPTDYNGERNRKGIVDSLIPLIPSKFVNRIGGKSKKAITYEEFQGLEEGKLHKVLLVTDKKATPPLFKALSIEFKDRLVFGEVRKSDSSKVIESLEISSFPTILLLPKEIGGEKIPYTGASKYAELGQFLSEYAAPETKKKTKAEKDKKSKTTKSKEKSTKSPTASTKPEKSVEPFDPTIEELTCEDCVEKKCLGIPGACVIAFLTKEDGFPESIASFDEQINILREIKKKFHARNAKITFVWTNAIKHGKQLINDFGVSDMFPSVIAIDKKKSQYSLLRTAFEVDSVSKFLDVFLAGGGRIPYSKPVVLDKSKKVAEPANDEL